MRGWQVAVANVDARGASGGLRDEVFRLTIGMSRSIRDALVEVAIPHRDDIRIQLERSASH
jgi:hypothetical protein